MSLTDISKMPARVKCVCWDGIRWKSFLEKRKSRNFVIEAKEKENHFETEVGPGVYDIHSPRVPSVEEIVKALEIMLTKVDRDKLWGNPDCGLKTRGVAETDASLRNMVEAAKQVRSRNTGCVSK